MTAEASSEPPRPTDPLHAPSGESRPPWLIVLAIVGLVLGTGTVAWSAPLVDTLRWRGVWLGTGTLLLIGSLSALFSRVLVTLPDVETVRRKEERGEISDRNDYLYGKFISFLGMVILVLTLVCVAGLGGSLVRGGVSIPFVETPGGEATQPQSRGGDAGREADEGGRQVERRNGAADDGGLSYAVAFTVVLSLLLAIVGSVFFAANSLWQKRGHEDFSLSGFWSGFWFRIGESLLFVLVIFLILCSDPRTSDGSLYERYINWLPAFALLMGMFVKSGERLIFGLAERLFAIAQGLLPPAREGAQDKPGKVRNLRAEGTADLGTELTWDEPLSGGRVEHYRIELKRTDEGKYQQVGETHGSTRRFRLDTAEGEVRVRAGNGVGEGEGATISLGSGEGPTG